MLNPDSLDHLILLHLFRRSLCLKILFVLRGTLIQEIYFIPYLLQVILINTELTIQNDDITLKATQVALSSQILFRISIKRFTIIPEKCAENLPSIINLSVLNIKVISVYCNVLYSLYCKFLLHFLCITEMSYPLPLPSQGKNGF